VFAVVLAPDQPVDRNSAWDSAYPWDEGNADEGQAEDAHHQHHEYVGVFGRLEGFDLRAAKMRFRARDRIVLP
jgi:hypothetical protein